MDRLTRRALSWLRNDRFLDLTPVFAMVLLETANGFQLWEMWTTRTSLGQSPWGWVCVNAALLLWLNWYRQVTPERVWTVRATLFGLAMNAAVILSTLILK
jgi:FtsH-binding integral membrane protein